MACTPCQQVRTDLIAHIATGRLAAAAATATKGAKMLLAGKPAAPPPVVPRGTRGR